MRPTAILIPVLALGACAEPIFVDRAQGTIVPEDWPNQVVFLVPDTYHQRKPSCIAILPLTAAGKTGTESTAKVRRALYAHLAPQAKRDIELARIDHVLKDASAETPESRRNLGVKLKCRALLIGEVTEYGSDFLGLYSRVSVGADLKLVDSDDGAVLWEGRHLARSHGGTLPLSPIGVAMGIVDAASNIRDEQILRVTDDLARRLVSTIPDNEISSLDDPAGQPPTIPPRQSAKEFLASLEGKPADERRRALIAAVENHRFPGGEGQLVVDALLVEVPSDPATHVAIGNWKLAEGDHGGALAAARQASGLAPDSHPAYYLEGRVLMRDQAFAQAEPAVLKAVALDRSNPGYLNALGVISAEKGAPDRALAAYRMAIDVNPSNGFAYYNSAVIHVRAGQLEQAGDAFYGAGLAYLKAGDPGRAGKALADLKDIAAAGQPVHGEISTLESAISAFTRRKK